jgi:hypothetical protein
MTTTFKTPPSSTPILDSLSITKENPVYLGNLLRELLDVLMKKTDRCTTIEHKNEKKNNLLFVHHSQAHSKRSLKMRSVVGGLKASFHQTAQVG